MAPHPDHQKKVTKNNGALFHNSTLCGVSLALHAKTYGKGKKPFLIFF
jgi:hypothetical protein